MYDGFDELCLSLFKNHFFGFQNMVVESLGFHLLVVRIALEA
jgi:hypothetical protein